MKERICIFAGTTEGRILARELRKAYDLTVCVATEYGRKLLDGIDGIFVRVGRMDRGEMELFIRGGGFSRVIDATHPYAGLVSGNIRASCDSAGAALLRVLRDTPAVSDAVYVSSAGDARDYLVGRDGNILLTTGSKELGSFTGLDMSRVWARVLPMTESLAACEAAGIAPGHIIAMQGPFSAALNEALMRNIDAKWLVTKASGAAGGFEEKLAAARAVGAVPVIIGRPDEASGVSVSQALRLLLPPTKRVTLIGAGPGGEGALTLDARRALESCDALIGAGPVLDAIKSDKPKLAAYLPPDVRAALESGTFRRPAVVLRGDVGFFSGAERLRDALPGYELTLIPGVASPVYFASRLGIPWEDVKLMSLHGRDAGLIRAVDENRRVITLTGGENTVPTICQRLCRYGLGELDVTVGERLSYPEERLTRGPARELAGRDFDSLSIMLIENPTARRRVRRGIPDEEFIRGDVPMTKSEIRALCLSALSPAADSVIWDIGAGTGSVCVECALSAPEGTVYAVERSPDACELIRQNAVKFRAENIRVVVGTAPEVLEELPAPTHVFIGGSSGNIRQIVAAVYRKNPSARVVATAVTLETQAELTGCARSFGLDSAVTVSAARSESLGSHTLMLARDPVTIFTFIGGVTDG